MGLVDPEQQAKENDFLNPGDVDKKKMEKQELEDAERLILMDEIKN